MDIPSGDSGSALSSQHAAEQSSILKDLQLGEEPYRLLIEMMNDGLVVIDDQLNFTYVNQKFCDLIGYTRDELIHQPLISFLDATNQNTFEQQIAKRRRGLQSTYELQWKTKQGNPIITLVSGSPLSRHAGFAGSFGVVTDITERKQVEERLQLSERRLLEAQRMAHIGYWDAVLNDRLVWSDETYRIFGLEPQQMPMNLERLLERVHPQDQERVATAIQEAVMGQKSYDLEYRIIRPDNTVRFIHSQGEVSYDTDGQPTRMFGTLMDISERKRIEDVLHEREQHSQSLLRLSKSLEQAQTYFDVLNAARDEVRALLGYQNLWVYLLTEDKQYCRVLAAEGHIAEKLFATDDIATLRIQGDPMLETIAEGQDIVVVEDARTDPRTNKKIVAQLGNRTIVNVPIILLDQHLGSVGTGTFGDEGIRVPSLSEREYLTAMASHLAVALQRIHLLIQRKQAEEERATHLRYFEGMDQVNRAMQGTTDLEQMMQQVLDVLLKVFDCDRAWLVFPCDPEATTWQVPMERTRPEYPGVLPIGVELPLDPVGAEVYRILRDSPRPVQFNTASERPVPKEIEQAFKVQSFIAMAFYPTVGNAWAFGLHQCSYPRVWTAEEERLFQAISYRLSDVLSSMLAYRDLQKSEQNLRQSHNLLQAIIEAAPTAIIGLDLDGNVQLVWNTTAEKMLGWSAAEAMGQLLPSVSRENQVQFKSFRDRIRRGESLNGVEVSRQKKDGTPIDYSIYASPLYDAHGSLMGNIAVLVDITERKQREKALLESETRYRSIVAALAEGIVLQDRTGAIVTYNAAAESILGLMGSQMLGQNWVDLDWHCIYEDGSHFPSDEHPAMVTLRTGIPQRSVIMGIQKTDGNLAWISINSEPLIHPNEALPYAVITSFADITERKRAHNIMQARLRLLEFAGTHSMDELLTATLDEIEKLTESTIGFYHFLQPDQKTLSLQNWSTNTLKTLCTAEGKGRHYDVEQAGVWVDCVYERRPVIHNDYASLSHRKGLPEGHAPVIREAVVPIFRGNLIEAIIGVGNKATPYNENDIEIIAQLGDLSWDITERKRAEEALQKQYSTLRGIMENANALIFSVDRDYLYTNFNQAHVDAMKTLYGVEIEVGQSLLGYMHVVEDREIAKHNLDRALAGERLVAEAYSGEEFLSRRYFQVSHSPVQTETGEVVGVVVLAQDITERKEMARKLEESEKRLRLTLEATQIGVWDWNVEKGESYASPVYYTMLGYEPKVDPIKQNEWLERIHPDDLNDVKAKIQSVLSQDFTGYQYESRVRHADGTYRWQYIKGFAIERNADGNIARMLGIRMDITDRKQAEAALRESEQRYRQIFNNTSDSLYFLEVTEDGHFRNIDVNPAFEVSTGISRDQLIGKIIEETVPEETAQLVNAKYRRCVEVGVPIEEDIDLDLPSGRHSYQSVLMPVRDDSGNIYRIIGVSRDVTERKRAAEVLRQSEQQFRLLAENSTDMITRHAPDGTYLYASPACSTLLGYEPSDLIGHSAYEFLHPDDVPVVEQSHTTILTKPMIYTVQYRIRRKDGQYVWFETTSKTLRDDQTGTITEIQAASRDITERKEAEFVLQHYSRRLSILHEMDRHILKAQSPHDIANSVLEQIIHLIPCEWAGIMLHDDTSTEARMYALQHLPNARFPVENKYDVLSNQVMEQLKLGHSITISDLRTVQGPHTELSKQLMAENLHAKLMTPLMMQDQLMGVLVLASRQVGYFTPEHLQVAEEIGTQLAIAFHQANLNDQIARHTVELERRVRERTTELEHVNRELEAFGYSVSHDLRAPLRAIEGFAEIIARRHREDLNDEGRRYFDNIVQASEQMNQLITDLLAYARLGRQRQGLWKVIPLDPILSEVLDNLAPLIVEKGGHIQVADNLPSVRGDKTLLKQIFTNLLENALVYHRPGVPPAITVTYALEDNSTLISVEDNGLGIAPEFREKVFGIFQRLHNQEQYPGTGIGLAIVRKTVEMLGGSIWVESADTHGSRFCIKLFTDEEKDI